MNEYEATIQINPTDDIKFILEEPGCYESEIEMMKAGGTYDAFVKRVHDAIDWSHLFERINQEKARYSIRYRCSWHRGR